MRFQTLWLVAMPLALMGCLSETGVSATSEQVSCSPMTGKYDFHMVKTSGDCSDIKDSVIDYDYVGVKDCEVMPLESSNDGCHNHTELVCPPAPDSFTSFDLVTDQSEDGNSANGILTRLWLDTTTNTYYCRATYQVTITRKQ